MRMCMRMRTVDAQLTMPGVGDTRTQAGMTVAPFPGS
jgi:hypothetical protein